MICGFVKYDGFKMWICEWGFGNFLDFGIVVLTETNGAASLDYRMRPIKRSRLCKFIFFRQLPYKDRQRKWINAVG